MRSNYEGATLIQTVPVLSLMAIDHWVVDADTEDPSTRFGLYSLGDSSLGKPDEWVGVSRWEIWGLLVDKGVDPHLGPTDMEDAAEDIMNAREFE